MNNLVAIRTLKKDPKLAPIIKTIGVYNIKITRNKFESLVEAIITQQLSGAAAKSISNKFRTLYSTRFPQPNDVIRTSNAKLRKTGLSKMKVSYIKDLSTKIESGNLNLKTISKLTDDEIISELTKVKGIGKWTAEMFLIFSLGRMDVLPVDDLGLKKGVQRLLRLDELPHKNKIEEVAQKWRPYRSIATWYLWKSLKTFDAI